MVEVSHPAWSSAIATELVVTNTYLWVDVENHIGLDVGEVLAQLPRQGAEGEQRAFEILAGAMKELRAPSERSEPPPPDPAGQSLPPIQIPEPT